MKARDIVIGLVIVAFIGGAIFLSQKKESEEIIEAPESSSTEERLEERFNVEIPENVDKTELKDVTGGTSSAIAIRKFENGKFSLTILADLLDPQGVMFYQGWLEKGDKDGENYSLVSAGKMTLAKGGWMLNFESNSDYSDYNKITVSLEKVSDSNLEEPILEGSF